MVATRLWLREHIARLPLREAIAILRYYYEGWTLAEVGASLFDVSSDNAAHVMGSRIVKRAVERLREEARQEGLLETSPPSLKNRQ
jgi:DNA-directed RNA polymerase specialized sigma24 family protein